MIDKIIEWSAKNRFFVFLGLLISLVWGIYSIKNIPLDAIPDLSDVQVIIFTEWPGRSPDIIEDQITYPIVSAMVAAPKVKVARGYSFFGLSFVYVIFEDGTDIYWARSRTIEYLSKIRGNLPGGVNPVLGPDATGVGWGFQYALVDKSGKHGLDELRSFQDWYLKYWLESVPGVAEVASVGGYVKQYQIEINPNALLAYNIPLKSIINAVKKSNNDVGGRIVEISDREYIVRGRGYIKNISDIKNIPVALRNGKPVLIKDIANVHIGPDMRRGAAELDGEGEVVGGIVVVRYGENVLKVIQRVKEKIKEIKSSLPDGMELVVTYDRSDLIERSIDTLKRKLLEELLIVSIVILIFLLHFRSALIPIISLPIAVVISFIPMYHMGVSANIMSLGGIAIAIGAMVDAAVIIIENAHKRLEEWEIHGKKENISDVLLKATKEVGRPIFFSLLIIAVSFMPIFTLEAQEGRLFKPLAFTKNFSMFFASIVAITIVPVLMQIMIKPINNFNFKPRWLSRILNYVWVGKIYHEENHPVSRFLFKIYTPILRYVLDRRWLFVILSVILLLSTVPVYKKLGSEFMPALNEGDILYMPTTLPGISIEAAKKWLQIQDKIIRQFPEVERVFGKIGRANTPTDPAPLSMVETVVKLKPQKQWPKVKIKRWYDEIESEKIKKVLRLIWPDKKRRSWQELIDALDKAVNLPGTTNAWTMPIKTRIDMLTTGIRTPIGIKIYGKDLSEIEKIGKEIEKNLSTLKGTRSVYAERVTGGYFIDFNIKREKAARYGLTVGDVEDVIETAIGGKNITTTVEGRERYPVNVRYMRDFRDNIDKLKKVMINTPVGAHIPISEVADIKLTMGPPVIKDENGMISGWVYVDIYPDKDIGSYIKEAKKLVSEKIKLPPGYYLSWSGQFEYMERAKNRLMLVIPVTVLIIFVLLYINTKSVVETLIVFVSVLFSLIGAFGILYILDYNMSVAVWVGIIALAGVDAEAGVILLMYIDLAYRKWVKDGKLKTLKDLEDAVIEGSVKRIRPKAMTLMCLVMGLLPIMWAKSYEAGADVMKRIAAPMVGGIFTSFILGLLIYPVIYVIWKWNFEMKKGKITLDELKKIVNNKGD